MTAYNKRIRLERILKTVGKGGRKLKTTETVATVWASMETKKHAPVARGDKLEFPVSVQFKTHYSSGYLAAEQVSVGSRLFTVLSKENPNDENRELIIWCRENTAN